MAKIALMVPELSWRQETVKVTRAKARVVRDLLEAQRDRINQELARHNEETLRELDAAANSRGRLGGSGWLGLGALLAVAAALLMRRTRGKQTRQQPKQGLRGFVSQVLSKGRQATIQAATKTRQVATQAAGRTEQVGVTQQRATSRIEPARAADRTTTSGQQMSGQPEIRVVDSQTDGSGNATAAEASEEGLLLEPDDRRNQ